MCDICGKIPSNHYCHVLVPSSNRIIQLCENESIEACGKAMCMICRSSWGNADYYSKVCNKHVNGTLLSNPPSKNQQGRMTRARKDPTHTIKKGVKPIGKKKDNVKCSNNT
mmetsp:Transcript_21363/g.20519  ORF Transcript_21363/g.20519 Transcript_21363/m.20519 type:complete len:111 (-) Transcript_21363:56-388(-)